MTLKNKKVLVSGGTGTFGKMFVKEALERGVRKIYVFSRDELKQSEMRNMYNNDSKISFLIGDIRDLDRLKMAFNEIDIVIHAAAQKQVPSCEYNPFEAVQTNILGGQNVINAAIACNVENVIFLSTDKAVNPMNLYGATKMCMEKLAINSSSYIGSRKTKISVVRYGNVLGSRGSVLNVFLNAKRTGKIPITDLEMTRFWMTPKQAVSLVLTALRYMSGSEIFIPKIPSMKIVELAEVIAPSAKIEVIGIRPGEKLHETLISQDESKDTIDCGEFYIIKPSSYWYKYKAPFTDFIPVEKNFSYSSDNNVDWLSLDEMEALIDEI